MVKKRKKESEPHSILREIIDKRIKEKKKLERKRSRQKKGKRKQKVTKTKPKAKTMPIIATLIKEKEGKSGIKVDKTIKQETVVSDAQEPVIKGPVGEEKTTSLVTEHIADKEIATPKQIEIKGEEKRTEFDIKDTLEHILKATAPSIKSKHKVGIKDATEHTPKATTPAKKEKKTGLTKEQLLKLKKARAEFIKQSTYKEMEKKVGEEVEEIKEIKEAKEAVKPKKVTTETTKPAEEKKAGIDTPEPVPNVRRETVKEIKEKPKTGISEHTIRIEKTRKEIEEEPGQLSKEQLGKDTSEHLPVIGKAQHSEKRAEFGIKETLEHILKATEPSKKKAGIKDTIEHILKAPKTKEIKPKSESKKESGITDTLGHILKGTKPSTGEHKAGIKDTLEHILHVPHKAAKTEKERQETGLTPEQLLKLKKARVVFIKQGKYKEMKKKVEKEVKAKEVKVKGKVEKLEKIEKVREPKKIEKPTKEEIKKKEPEFIKTGIEGLDLLFDEQRGVPKGTAVLVVGGPGTGKTLFCLHMINYAANLGEKCLYLSFEESEERLKQHMRDFGWDPDGLEKKGLLVIKRIDPYEISRSIEALLAQSRGELMIDMEGISTFIPKDFKPDRIVLDSVTALTAAFASADSSYRSYIEQSFLFLEKLGATTFLVSETEDAPKKLSPSGIEEFLADGVIILYNIRKEGVRERAIEIFKMRGSKFQEKIVAYQITDTGVIVYPQQQVFGALMMS